MSRSERLMQLELLLLSHPEGMRRAEIARRLGVHRSTVGRYIDELKERVDLWEDEYVIGISARESMDMMKLSVYESLAIHLSADLLAQHIEYQNPHLASGLRKMAENLRHHAPSMSSNIESIAEAIEVGTRKQNPEYIRVLETLTDSWVSGKMVKIRHLSSETGKMEETEFAPYFIGFAEERNGRRPISVTGRLRHASTVQTIDIRNVKDAVIQDQTYTIPDNLRAFKRPEKTSDMVSGDMIHLKLRVYERSALNSFEWINYKNLSLKEEPDGTYVCELQAENSIELVLRIIQCGTDLEVLEPKSFRERIKNEVKMLYELYHRESRELSS